MSSVRHVRQVCLQGAEWIRSFASNARGRFASDKGANLVEYALLISLIALVCMAALRYVGTATKSKMDCNHSAINLSSSISQC